MAFCYSCYIHFNHLSVLMERQGCLPDIVRVWFIGYMRPLNLFLVHEIPIRLHTVLVICRRLFLAQQLHVANLLLEHIHEIRPVI